LVRERLRDSCQFSIAFQPSLAFLLSFL
jgi:hypothetical protein